MEFRTMYLINVYLHVVAAMVWIGGMIFLAAVLLPAVKNHPERARLIHKIGLQFRIIGWICLILLLGTGLINMHSRGVPFDIEQLYENAYYRLIGIKLLLFIVIVIFSALHDFYVGTKATRQWMQQQESREVRRSRALARWLGRLNLLLALTAAALGVLFVRGGI